MERGITLSGNGQAPVQKYWKMLLQMLEEDKIHPYAMLSHRVLLDDLEAVYDKFDKKEDHMQKVFCQTRFSDPPAPETPQLTRF